MVAEEEAKQGAVDSPPGGFGMKAKIILVALAILSLWGGIVMAMPDGDWTSNPDILKIAIGNSYSASGIFAWQDPATDRWEVLIGLVEYGDVAGASTFYSDASGMVLIPVL